MEEIRTEQAGTAKKPKKKPAIPVFICLAVVLTVAAAVGVYLLRTAAPKGYYDYTVQKQQYYVEYSDQYDYWDVLTVEYPVLEEAGTSQGKMENLEQINAMFYDAAMDRVNYWHLKPNDEVKELQSEYHIFSSDVQCDVTWHSQYLVSVNYKEIYAPINPVWYVFITQRGLAVDLLNGENYAFTDILRLDEDFIDLWIARMNEEKGEEIIAPEDADIFLDWFSGSDEELAEYYDFAPFFYIDGEEEFVIGLSVNPTAAGMMGGSPSGTTFDARLTAEELAPYRTESVFWERYDMSEDTGEVRECGEKHENLWLGEQAGVWDYWEEK